MPRRGHFALHIMSYLKIKDNSILVLDPTYPHVDVDELKTDQGRDFYGGVEETLPLNTLKPLGKDVTLRMFVQSAHTSDKVDRRSRTGFIIF